MKKYSANCNQESERGDCGYFAINPRCGCDVCVFVTATAEDDQGW